MTYKSGTNRSQTFSDSRLGRSATLRFDPSNVEKPVCLRVREASGKLFFKANFSTASQAKLALANDPGGSWWTVKGFIE